MARLSLILSAGLHVAGVVVASVTWPDGEEARKPEPVSIPVYFEQAAQTPTAPQQKPEPEPEPQPEPEARRSVPPEEAEPLPDTAPEETPVPSTRPDPPEPEPEPEAEPERRLAANVQPRTRPDPPPQEDEPTDESLDLDALSERLQANQAAGPVGDELSPAEEAALISQLSGCWRLPAGAPEPERLVVTVRAELNRQGDLVAPPRVIGRAARKALGDRYWRMAADNARRAVLRCAPFDLPPEKYERWQVIEIRFDPSVMLGPQSPPS